MGVAFVFPGQGSQTVGMGKALFDAFAESKAVFQDIDEALGEDLSEVIFSGPEDTLTLTANAQPALMAVSMAAIVAMASRGITVANNADFVAGHSLGEYSALAAAGAFDFRTAARLLRTRGQAMQDAVPVGEGAMAAILNLDFAAVEEIAREAAGDEVCAAANDNAPGQVVISGHKTAVERAIELAKEAGAKRAIMLPVSAPFHSALMAPAADAMRNALASIPLNAPKKPLVANVVAEALTEPEGIRTRLIEQVTGRVRWRESVHYMAQNGVDTFVEIGEGRALSGMIRRIVDGARTFNVATPEDVDKLASQLSG